MHHYIDNPAPQKLAKIIQYAECLSDNHFAHCEFCTWKDDNEMNQGRKDDQEKLRFDLFPPEALMEIARVYTSGAVRYGDRNWEQGIKYGRVYAAAHRHLLAWWCGEKCDPDSGISHMAHSAWNCIALLAYELREMGEFDDRPRHRGMMSLGEK